MRNIEIVCGLNKFLLILRAGERSVIPRNDDRLTAIVQSFLLTREVLHHRGPSRIEHRQCGNLVGYGSSDRHESAATHLDLDETDHSIFEGRVVKGFHYCGPIFCSITSGLWIGTGLLCNI